jgi:hypothetical protein
VDVLETALLIKKTTSSPCDTQPNVPASVSVHMQQETPTYMAAAPEASKLMCLCADHHCGCGACRLQQMRTRVWRCSTCLGE